MQRDFDFAGVLVVIIATAIFAGLVGYSLRTVPTSPHETTATPITCFANSGNVYDLLQFEGVPNKTFDAQPLPQHGFCRVEFGITLRGQSASVRVAQTVCQGCIIAALYSVTWPDHQGMAAMLSQHQLSLTPTVAASSILGARVLIIPTQVVLLYPSRIIDSRATAPDLTLVKFTFDDEADVLAADGSFVPSVNVYKDVVAAVEAKR